MKEEVSTEEEYDIIDHEESAIIATEVFEGSAERYGNTFLLNWKQYIVCCAHLVTPGT